MFIIRSNIQNSIKNSQFRPKGEYSALAEMKKAFQSYCTLGTSKATFIKTSEQAPKPPCSWRCRCYLWSSRCRSTAPCRRTAAARGRTRRGPSSPAGTGAPRGPAGRRRGRASPCGTRTTRPRRSRARSTWGRRSRLQTMIINYICEPTYNSD